MPGDDVDRRGAPAPLALHLSGAVELYEGGARLAPLIGGDRFPWVAQPTRADRVLAEKIAAAPPRALAIALRIEAARRLADMTRGLQLYQAHPARRSLRDPRTIWRDGDARVLDFGGRGRPVFVTPSLINRHHILDLDQDASLLRWLVSRGVRPFLLDWGAPDEASRRFSLGDHVMRRLLPAFDSAAEAAGTDALGAVGYCMGGALTMALAAHRRARITRIVLIGAPWDFSKMTPMRAALASLGATGDAAALRRLVGYVETAFGVIPTEATEALFAKLDPGLVAKKFRKFAALDQAGAEARRFVLVEDWLNAGPPLAAAAALEGLVDWHLRNATMRGVWRVGDEIVAPNAFDGPVLIAAATRDRITPPRATEALACVLPNAKVLRPDAGHVGMIVGRDAMAQLWRPLETFLLG